MSNPRSVADRNVSTNDTINLYFLATMSPESLHLLYLCASLGTDHIPVNLLMTKFTMNNVNRLNEFNFMTLSDDKEMLSITPETRERVRAYLLKFRDERLNAAMQEYVLAITDALIKHDNQSIGKPAIYCYIALAQQLAELTETIGDTARHVSVVNKLASLQKLSGQHKIKPPKLTPEPVINVPTQPAPANAEPHRIRVRPDSNWDATTVASAFVVAGIGLFALSKLDDQSRQIAANGIRAFFNK